MTIRKKTNKAILSTALILAAAVAFTACGNNNFDENLETTEMKSNAIEGDIITIETDESFSEPTTDITVPVSETESYTDTSDDDENQPKIGIEDNIDADIPEGWNNIQGDGVPVPKPEQPAEPTPEINPDFDPQEVINLVRDMVRNDGDPGTNWFYDHPNVPAGVPCDMGWVELPGMSPTRGIESIAEGIYSCIEGEKKDDSDLTAFYVEYLGLNSRGEHRFKLYRG